MIKKTESRRPSSLLPVIALAILMSGFSGLGCSKKSSSPKSKSVDKFPVKSAVLSKKDGKTVEAAEYYQSSITSAAIGELQKHESLQEISFIECSKLPAEAIDELTKLPNLNSLNFVRCDIGDDDLSSMKRLSNIEKLSLAHTKVTAKGIASLKDWKNLNCLVIGDGIDMDSLTPFPALSNLRCLELTTATVTLSKIQGLEKLEKLRTLKIPNAVMTDDDLAAMPKLAKLAEFVFSPAAISHKGIAQLAKLPSLKTVFLAQSKISDKALAELSGFKSLEKLNLNGCSEITDAGLDSLAALPNLREIDLGGCKKITNEGVKHLIRHTNLSRINLVLSGVDGAGIQHLKGIKSLKSVSVTMEKTTEAQAKQLREVLPGCEVHRVQTTPPRG